MFLGKTSHALICWKVRCTGSGFTHTHSWMVVSTGNVESCYEKTGFSVVGPACLVAVKGGGSTIPLGAEGAHTDSTEEAHDVSAMKAMTGHKVSTNQKHSPSTSPHK